MLWHIHAIMISKSARQQTILHLIRDHAVHTQTELVEELAAEGIPVNQSTISRDIQDLGLIKSRRDDGGFAYSLPTNVVALNERSIRILREFVESVDGSASLAVVHTGNGNAQPVAEAVDRLRMENVVGTVAGDNTLMVVLRDGTTWEQFRDQLEEALQ